jgi:hypothetical protein
MPESSDTPSGQGQAPATDGLSVTDFRHLVADHETSEEAKQQQDREAAAAAHRELVKQLVDKHITDAEWNALVHAARRAAEHGEKEFQLFRFPSEVCSDGGRAINAPEPDWPKTLRGEAADIYRNWARDLEPGGFHMAARVIDFPNGVPGDIGLFLVWGA